ncbi:MFS transporter [Sulfodiicoccus acidiphilus]|uniref:MFS transporter n=2 Tax=Sulfodiicoccus acidiphilus TaxID=1670455 RepID=A0A830GY43_9CREN|nr:MFS transporter [Sulfodiicoccus acidiphilus]
MRIQNVIGAAVGDLMGYVVFTSWRIEWKTLLISMVVVALVAGGGYVINDIRDVEIDKVNKPERPLPSGEVSLREAKAITLISFLGGASLSALLGPVPFTIALLTIFLLVSYALWLKKQGPVGNLVVALTTALSIFFGGISVSVNALSSITLMIPVVYSFLLTLGREVVKGVEDYNGDYAHGVKTLAIRLGVRPAWNTAKGLILSTALISPLPILFHYNLAYIVLLLAFLFYVVKTLTLPPLIENAARGSKYLKVAALIGIAAFILGSVPFVFPH